MMFHGKSLIWFVHVSGADRMCVNSTPIGKGFELFQQYDSQIHEYSFKKPAGQR